MAIIKELHIIRDTEGISISFGEGFLQQGTTQRIEDSEAFLRGMPFLLNLCDKYVVIVRRLKRKEQKRA